MPLSTTAVRAGRAFVELFADDRKLRRTLRNVSRRLKAFGASVTGLGMRMMGMGAMILAPLVAATKLFGSMGDNLNKMSARTGIAVEALSEMGFAAEQSGANLEQLEKGIKTMQRGIVDAGRGLSTQKDALADLGLVYADLKNLSPEQQFKLIAERIGKLQDPTKQAALSLMLFGRSGQKLLPLLKGGARGIEELQKEARKLGITMSTEDAKAAAEFTDQMNRVWSVLKRVIFEIGSVVAPLFENWGQKIMDNVGAIKQWVSEHKGLILTAVKAAAALVGIGLVLIPLGMAISAAAVLLNPLVLGLAAIGAAAYFVGKSFSKTTTSLIRYTGETRRLVDEHEKAVAVDQQHVSRLEELAAQQQLTNDEMKEARGLLDDLKARYKSVTGSVDEATRSLKNFGESVGEEARKHHIALIKEDIAEMSQALFILQRAQRNYEKETTVGEGVWQYITGGDILHVEAIKELHTKLRAARKELAALYEGGTVGGDKGRPDPTAGEPGFAALTVDLDDRLHRLRLQQIEDEHERAIALIRHRYRTELDEAKGNTEQYLKLLTARGLEEQAIHNRFAKRKAEEDQRRAKEAAEAKADLDYDIQRLQIERDKKGTDQARALLDLEEQREKLAAVGQGRNKAYLDAIAKKYGLQRGLLDASAMTDRTVQVQGTFSAAAAQRLGAGGPADQIAKTNQQIAQNTKKLLEQARRARLVFT